MPSHDYSKIKKFPPEIAIRRIKEILDGERKNGFPVEFFPHPNDPTMFFINNIWFQLTFIYGEMYLYTGSDQIFITPGSICEIMNAIDYTLDNYQITIHPH